MWLPDLPESPHMTFNEAANTFRDLARSVPPSLLPRRIGGNVFGWRRNIHLLSIDYAFRPRLRIRLTLGGLTLPQETLGFRRKGFEPFFSLLVPAFSLLHGPGLLTVPLHSRAECSPTARPRKRDRTRSFGVMLSPVHYRREIARLVRSYPLFK